MILKLQKTFIIPALIYNPMISSCGIDNICFRHTVVYDQCIQWYWQDVLKLIRPNYLFWLQSSKWLPAWRLIHFVLNISIFTCLNIFFQLYWNSCKTASELLLFQAEYLTHEKDNTWHCINITRTERQTEKFPQKPYKAMKAVNQQ